MSEFDRLKKKAEQLLKVQDQIVLDAAQYAIALLRLRIAKGIGLDDRQMKPYTPGYSRRKKKLGRRVDVRDLTLTGRMLGSLHAVKRGPGQAGVEFTDARSQLLASVNQRISAWFGLSPQDQEKLRAYLEQRFTEMMKGN